MATGCVTLCHDPKWLSTVATSVPDTCFHTRTARNQPIISQATVNLINNCLQIPNKDIPNSTTTTKSRECPWSLKIMQSKEECDRELQNVVHLGVVLTYCWSSWGSVSMRPCSFNSINPMTHAVRSGYCRQKDWEGKMIEKTDPRKAYSVPCGNIGKGHM